MKFSVARTRMPTGLSLWFPIERSLPHDPLPRIPSPKSSQSTVPIMSTHKVTQATIAKMHGVSRQAVGYALGLYTNSSIKLSRETRERIIRTAEELDYRPNRLAQIICGRRSEVIGVVNFGGITQMSVQNARSIAREIQDAGFQLMLHDVTWYAEGMLETTVRSLIDHRVEGVVLISPTDWLPSSVLDLLVRSQIPLVSCRGVHLPGIPNVESDYERETFELMSGLLDAGYRTFTFFTGRSNAGRDEPDRSPSRKRMKGFQSALEARGGTVGSLTPSGRVPQGDFFFASPLIDWSDPYHAAYQGALQLLARDPLPEVLVCANDDWAAGALRACGEKGLRVPEDLALAGHDGTVISNYGYIPITTVIQDLSALARQTITTLKTLIEKKPLPKKAWRIQIPGHIAWRASTQRVSAA